MNFLRRQLLYAGLLHVASFASGAGKDARLKSEVKIAFISSNDVSSRSLFSEIVNRATKSLGLTDKNFIKVDVSQNESGVVPNQLSWLNALTLDLAITVSTWTTQAAARELGSTPIIFSSHLHPDIWRNEFTTSDLAGFTYATPTLGKRVEMLREICGRRIRRIAIIGQSTKTIHDVFYKELLPEDLREIGIDSVRLITTDLHRTALDALVGIDLKGIDAFLMHESIQYFALKERLVEFFSTQQPPILFPHNAFAKAGGLASFTPYYRDFTAVYVDFIRLVLGGVPAKQIPILTPQSFHFALNVGAAKKQGIRIPNSLLKSADEVILD